MQKLVLLLVSGLVSLALAELALRELTPYPIHSTRANRIDHVALGWVLDPEFAEADGSGFRNPDGIADVDLVTLGDSHTYGFNVRREDNWPSQLADAAGISVYNYGMGGYGVLQHYWLMDQALKRDPRTVIVGLYLTNDLADTCLMADTEFWRSELPRLGLEGITCELDERGEGEVTVETPLWQRTALRSAFQHLVEKRLTVLRKPERFVWFDDAGRPTPLSKRHLSRHVQSTDRARSGVASAHELVERLLERMAGKARQQGIRFAVLFIPSKENVLFESADPADPFHGQLAKAVDQERALTRDLDRFLRARGIPTAHALGALRNGADEPLYPGVASGHPTKSGYRRYAKTAGALLANPPLAPTDAQPREPPPG